MLHLHVCYFRPVNSSCQPVWKQSVLTGSRLSGQRRLNRSPSGCRINSFQLTVGRRRHLGGFSIGAPGSSNKTQRLGHFEKEKWTHGCECGCLSFLQRATRLLSNASWNRPQGSTNTNAWNWLFLFPLWLISWHTLRCLNQGQGRVLRVTADCCWKKNTYPNNPSIPAQDKMNLALFDCVSSMTISWCHIKITSCCNLI